MVFQDLDWEVVENPTHTSSPKPERKRPHEGGRSGVSASKGEEERATDNSSPKPPPRTKKTASKTVVEPVTGITTKLKELSETCELI